MNVFPVDVTLEREDICNLEQEQRQLVELAVQGKRVVIYGRRNTGKTSLILNVVIPQLLIKNKHAICVFVDLLGVESLQDVETRLQRGIERALTRAYPGRKFLNDLLDVAKSFRPTVETDSLTGNISISITSRQKSRSSELEELVEQLGELHKSTNVFLALDEFQDIATVPELTALLRGALQHLPKNLPVFICGSKKHLLSSMFGPHKAPFAGWGRDLEIPTVNNADYRNKYFAYANDRLAAINTRIDQNSFDFLVSQCDGVPEALNIVLDHISRKLPGKVIAEESVRSAIAAVCDERRGRFDEQLIRFRGPEKSVLTAIAKHGPIKHPKGKVFLALTKSLAPSTVFNVIRQLESNADIYQTDDGFVVADPLLAVFLRRHR